MNKKVFGICRAAAYVVVFSGVMMTVVFFGFPQLVKADEGACCTYGVDCMPGLEEAALCCVPRVNEADCSQQKKNYCRNTTSCPL